MNKFKSTKSYDIARLNFIERHIAIKTFSNKNKYQEKLLWKCYRLGLKTNYSECINTFSIGFILDKYDINKIGVFCDILNENTGQIILNINGASNTKYYDDTPIIVIGTSLTRKDSISKEKVNEIIKKCIKNLDKKDYKSILADKIFKMFDLLKDKETCVTIRFVHDKDFRIEVEFDKNKNFRVRNYLINLFKENNIPEIRKDDYMPTLSYGYIEKNINNLYKDMDKLINVLKKYDLKLQDKITDDTSEKLKRIVEKRIS